jgi:hypothetical protein
VKRYYIAGSYAACIAHCAREQLNPRQPNVTLITGRYAFERIMAIRKRDELRVLHPTPFDPATLEGIAEAAGATISQRIA